MTTATNRSRGGLSDGVVSELATYWDVLPGHEDELRAAAQRFADTLSQVPLEKNIHTGLRDQRHVIFDNGQRLMWATTFENEWDPYFEDFVLIGIEHFLDWMQHTAQYTHVTDVAGVVRRSGEVQPDNPDVEAQMKRTVGGLKAIVQSVQSPATRLLQQPEHLDDAARSSRPSTCRRPSSRCSTTRPPRRRCSTRRSSRCSTRPPTEPGCGPQGRSRRPCGSAATTAVGGSLREHHDHADDTALELGDIQAAALMPRPNPYAGAYLARAHRRPARGSGAAAAADPPARPGRRVRPRPAGLARGGAQLRRARGARRAGGVAGQLPARVPAGHGRSRGVHRGRRGERAGALGGTAGVEGRPPRGGRAGPGHLPDGHPGHAGPRRRPRSARRHPDLARWTCTCHRTGASSSASRTASASRPSRAPTSSAATRTRRRSRPASSSWATRTRPATWPPIPQPEVLGRNGTYVAFRKLHQRVAAFRQYLHAERRGRRARRSGWRPSSSGAGPAARRWPWPRTRTTPSWAPTPRATTPSCTATTRGGSSARSARTPGG